MAKTRTTVRVSAAAKSAVRTVLARLGYTVLKTRTLEAMTLPTVSRSPSLDREHLGRQVWVGAAGHILYGPFANQYIDDEYCSSRPDIASKILGQYEVELHPIILAMVDLSPDVVINVGCGDGYYAVGLARLLPQARVLARDTDDNRLRVTAVNAERNAVSDRVIIGGGITFDELQGMLEKAERPALLIDAEGAERELLNPAMVKALTRTFMLVEVHDDFATDASLILAERFGNTHTIRRIEEGARCPARVPELRLMCADDRWLIMSEGRTSVGQWMWLTPRQVES